MTSFYITISLVDEGNFVVAFHISLVLCRNHERKKVDIKFEIC
jgi:hypothetical protein